MFFSESMEETEWSQERRRVANWMVWLMAVIMVEEREEREEEGEEEGREEGEVEEEEEEELDKALVSEERVSQTVLKSG